MKTNMKHHCHRKLVGRLVKAAAIQPVD